MCDQLNKVWFQSFKNIWIIIARDGVGVYIILEKKSLIFLFFFSLKEWDPVLVIFELGSLFQHSYH